MEPISPLPAIVCLLIVFATSWIICKTVGTNFIEGRNETIDGLRGYLAVFVCIHHASIWYFYLRTGRWESPPSNLYNHFGQSSVAMFFMVTGFLFFSKIITKDLSIDWTRIYVSRILRLTPLYLLTIVLVLFISFINSEFKLNQKPIDLIYGLIKWTVFTVGGTPNLNGLENTWIVVAGVTWSLPYEWFFYFSLPIMSILIGRKTSPSALIFSGFIIIFMLAIWNPGAIHLKSFLGGIVAALLFRSEKFKAFASTWVGTLTLLMCISLCIVFFKSAYSNIPLLLLGIAFSIIACGNSIFGLLANPISRILGEMAYGVYLLHGLIYFCVFKLLIGFANSQNLSPVEHWVAVSTLMPFLITSGYLAHRFIELPAMKNVDSTSLLFKRIRRRIFRN